MNYNDYTYLWPPRPEQQIPQGLLNFYERKGFWAQKKKNGTCCVIFVRGNEVIFKTRHNDNHKLWSPLPSHIKFFQGASKWNVYVGELLHSKTPHIKNQLFLFDRIVEDGIHLDGWDFENRYSTLLEGWDGTDEGDQIRVHEYVSVAKNYKSGFKELFSSLKPEDEGLVLKDPHAPLRSCLQDSNGSWQVKCRVPHKNYGF